MGEKHFLDVVQAEARKLTEVVSETPGDWIFGDYIETFRCVLAITLDREVVAKVLEQLLRSRLEAMAVREGYTILGARERDAYPDLSFIDNTSGDKYAVSMKSTHRTGDGTVSGMPLGSFTGYFRKRESRRNVTFLFDAYKEHIVTGAVFSLAVEVSERATRFFLSELGRARVLIWGVVFFAQPSYTVASDQPESGNTKNIESVVQL
jgi:hypothetical protein